MSGSFPEMHALAAALGADHAAILDGEVCAFAPDGRSDFGLLQNRTHVQRPSPALLARTPVRLMIFDLLHLDGASLLERSYDQRREQMLGLGLQDRAWATPAALTGPLNQIQDASRQHGLEGSVHKRHDSTYLPGRRTPHWRKTKNVHEQTAVVVGWKPGQRGRAGQIGALLLAVHAPDGQLEYIGNVGTGFTQATLTHLQDRLTPLARPASPLPSPLPRADTAGVAWVEPVLVVECVYSQYTRDGRLRHPSFKGIREDYDPAQVRREP